MKIPSFAPIYLAFKAKGSSFILFWGHGWAFLISLSISVVLGVVTIILYDVPVHTTEIEILPIEGGMNEHYYTRMNLDYDYGWGFNNSYRPEFKKLYDVELYVLRDSTLGDERRPNLYYYNKKIPINYQIKDSIKKVLIRDYGNDILCDSLYPIFYVREVSSIAKKQILNKRLPTDKIRLIPTSIVRGDESWDTLSDNILDSLNGWSLYYDFSDKDSVANGVRYIERINYFGINKIGNFIIVPLTELSLRGKPEIYSPHDISQAYFKYKLNFPRSRRHRSILEIDFGGATEFSNIAPQPDSVAMSAIFYYDEEKLKRIAQDGMWLHAKYKQLENIQIIRMFIMTTLWGFFVALTFSSLGKFLRTRSRHFKIKHKELYERS